MQFLPGTGFSWHGHPGLGRTGFQPVPYRPVANAVLCPRTHIKPKFSHSDAHTTPILSAISALKQKSPYNSYSHTIAPPFWSFCHSYFEFVPPVPEGTPCGGTPWWISDFDIRISCFLTSPLWLLFSTRQRHQSLVAEYRKVAEIAPAATVVVAENRPFAHTRIYKCNETTKHDAPFSIFFPYFPKNNLLDTESWNKVQIPTCRGRSEA